MSKTLTDDPLKAPSKGERTNTVRPEFFRLPQTGGDPFFGLTRAYYYGEEKAGRLKLVRLRKPGAERGVTLVPYARISTLVQKAQAQAEADADLLKK